MTTKTRYVFQRQPERYMGRGLMLALPFSILLWVIILVILF